MKNESSRPHSGVLGRSSMNTLDDNLKDSGLGRSLRAADREPEVSRQLTAPSTRITPDSGRGGESDSLHPGIGPRQTASPTADVRIVRGLEGLNELRASWDSLSPPCPSPMLSHEWILAWADVYAADRDLELHVVEESGNLAIAPLVRTSRGGLRYELAGPNDLIEAMDFVYEDASLLPEMTRALARSGIPLRLWRIPAESPVIEAIRRSWRWRGFVRCQRDQACPSIPLDATWEDPECHLEKRHRSNVRRARRIAEGIGPVTSEIHAPTPAEVGTLLDEAYAVEAAGWKSREGSALAKSPLLGEFFRRYARGAAERGELRVCFLRIGGRPAAMKLASVTGDRFWLLSMGFSEEFERCSPGTLLLLETLRYAARAGLRSYEFLGADEPWVQAWNPTLRPCISLRTYPFNRAGAVALAHDSIDLVKSKARRAEVGAMRVNRRVTERMARAYVAGPRAEDALQVCEALSRMGLRSVVGYVNLDNEDPRVVERSSLAAVEALAKSRLDAYLSVKAPVLRFDAQRLRSLAEETTRKGMRLHFDAMAAEDTDRTFQVIRDLRPTHPSLGCTLPGRWRRSVQDAETATELGLHIRVVQGEWAQPPAREVNPRIGFLAVVDNLAGRAKHATVATHDPALARASLRRLKSAGTPCELEVLLGYPIHRVLPIAAEESVPVRVYVPFGHLALPYTIRAVRRKPRIAGWALRDLIRAVRGAASRGKPAPG